MGFLTAKYAKYANPSPCPLPAMRGEGGPESFRERGVRVEVSFKHNISVRGCFRPSSLRAYFHQPHRASKPHHAHVHASVYPVDECLFKKGREP